MTSGFPSGTAAVVVLSPLKVGDETPYDPKEVKFASPPACACRGLQRRSGQTRVRTAVVPRLDQAVGGDSFNEAQHKVVRPRRNHRCWIGV